MLLFSASTALPCGPYLPEAVFVPKTHPDFPIADFLKGELGIIRPTYDYPYLVIAYKYLKGQSLSNDQVNSVILASQPYDTEDNHQIKWPSPGFDESYWIKQWTKERTLIKVSGPVPSVFRRHSEIEFVNPGEANISGESADSSKEECNDKFFSDPACHEDAFRTAVNTLHERIRKFGIDSPEVIEWTHAQDIVFSNCSDRNHMPEPASPQTNALIKADRAYQIAAAQFYSGQFDEAEKGFRKISEDKTSPWRQISIYLIGRTLAHKAFAKSPCAPDKELLGKAAEHLERILTDIDLKSVHQASWEMLRFVRLQIEPVKAFKEIANTIVNKPEADFFENVNEYNFLLRNRISSIAADKTNVDNLTDWILTLSGNARNGPEHAVSKWEETSSVEWLTASLMGIKSEHPKKDKLVDAAMNIKPDNPAYLTARYHALRIMSESGKAEEARKGLDELILAKDRKIPTSSMNLLLSLRMSISVSMDDFLKYAQRTSVLLYNSSQDSEEYPKNISRNLNYTDLNYSIFVPFSERLPLFDNDSVEIMNDSIPLSTLLEVLNRNDIPEHLRYELAVAVWTRAVLLEKFDIADKAASVLIRQGTGIEDYVEGFMKANRRDEKIFSAAYLIAKFPGMKPYLIPGIGRLTPIQYIDDYRDNWWCVTDLKNPEGMNVPSPGFLSKPLLEEGLKEREALSKIESAPFYIGDIIIKYAKSNPSDKRIPEALHLVVKATRYGCGDACYSKYGDESFWKCLESSNKKISKYSKEAFKLLHKKYPKSKWSRKTPYWF